VITEGKQNLRPGGKIKIAAETGSAAKPQGAPATKGGGA